MRRRGTFPATASATDEGTMEKSHFRSKYWSLYLAGAGALLASGAAVLGSIQGNAALSKSPAVMLGGALLTLSLILALFGLIRHRPTGGIRCLALILLHPKISGPNVYKNSSVPNMYGL